MSHEPIKVCMILGDAVGGIRKHVHDILYSAPLGVDIFYIHSDISDVVAQRDFTNFQESGIEHLLLPIAKNPAPSDLANILTIWSACRKSKIDVLHGHGAKGGLYARLVGFLMRKPVVYTPHGGSVHPRFGKMMSLLFAAVEYVLKFATTLFVFESQYTRAAFRRLAGSIPDNRELVSYNGVRMDLLAPQRAWSGCADRQVRLLTVGLLSEVKGQDVAIRATAILKKRGWKVSLDLCGDGEAHSTLESLAVAMQVENAVRFHGGVEDVLPHYEACDIVVIPSRFESFGYVAVEAALMGRAIVASATGGLLETVIDGETGLSFATGNPDALADAVEATLTDLAATQQRIKVGRARALVMFDVKKMTTQLFSAYRRLASR